MVSIVIVAHSGSGHTRALAEAVARGAGSVPGTAVHLLDAGVAHERWDLLDAADAIVFGAPTYMGSVSAGMKAFMEKCSRGYRSRLWQDKLAAGFTNAAGLSGDKLNTLVDLAIFAAQLGMHWINLGLVNGTLSTTDSPDALNRMGFFLGAASQSPVDLGPDRAPPESDRLTAEHLGRRVAEAAHQWALGRKAYAERGA